MCSSNGLLHFLYLYFAKIPKVYAYRVIFNTSSNTCCALLYSSIYQALSHGSTQLKDILLPAVVLVAVYFITNSILTSVAIAWSHGESILKFWIKSCMPLVVEYPLSLASAVAIVAPTGLNEYVPLLVAPLIFVACVGIIRSKRV